MPVIILLEWAQPSVQNQKFVLGPVLGPGVGLIDVSPTVVIVVPFPAVTTCSLLP